MRAQMRDIEYGAMLSIALSFDDVRLRAFGLIYFGSRSSLPPALRMEIEHLLIDRLLDEATPSDAPAAAAEGPSSPVPPEDIDGCGSLRDVQQLAGHSNLRTTRTGVSTRPCTLRYAWLV